ncbi:TIGR04222 domain-containing membrane protein [Amycolatopsis anabasis]|uniref:TIGR04222 domain-containing membrane protein n=1 Tax=Amycolatopsis anabasis TaxID=1840409 RepID=UPI00131E5894|nr:TIGR04222 domain-containing membrane protein [Amycolatopsis anabasis]
MDQPGDLADPVFLVVYGILLALPVVLGVLWSRFLLRAPRADTPRSPTPYQLAYLAGDSERVADTALAAALANEQVRLDPAGVLSATTRPATGPFERHVQSCARHGVTPYVIKLLLVRSEPMRALKRDLVGRGLLVDAGPWRRVCWTVYACYAVVFLFGLTQTSTGVPIGDLAAVLVLAAVAAIVALAWATGTGPTRPSRAGKRLLRQARRDEPADTATRVALGGLTRHPEPATGRALAWPSRSCARAEHRDG